MLSSSSSIAALAEKGGVVNVDFVSNVALAAAAATLNSNDPQKGCAENGRSCCLQRITVADKNEGKGI